MITVFVASLLPISTFIFKFLANPINVSVDRDYFHFNLTFPPLTLCLHNRLNETALVYFVQENGKVAKKKQLIKFLNDLVYFDAKNMEKLGKFRKFSTSDYASVSDFCINDVYQCLQSIIFQILLNVSNNMNAQIVTPQNLSYELQPILTEVGLCYTFNSRVAHLFNPITTIPSAKRVDAGRHKKIDLYKINFYDAETEGTLTYTYTGSNFDVSFLLCGSF